MKKKRCSGCGETKALSEFNRERRRKDGHQRVCRVCQAIYHKRYYTTHKKKMQDRSKQYYARHTDAGRAHSRQWRKTHPEKMKAHKRRSLAKCRKRNQIYLAEYLETHSCTGLGPHKGALIFHHPGTKNFRVGNLVWWGHSLAQIQAEIQLCAVLCRACHARLHGKKQGARDAKGRFLHKIA